MKVLMIGAGSMGLTFAEGMVGSHHIKDRDLFIYDKDEAVQARLRKDDRFTVASELQSVLERAHIIFVAVKPYHCEELFAEMKPHLMHDQILVSLMAGVTIEFMQESTGLTKIVRAMPNLPAKVGSGVTAFTETPAVSKVEQVAVRNLIDSTGTTIHVDNEHFINKSTGISGSGPAYVFYFMEAMMQAARKMGFSDNDARLLVENTFEGAIALFKDHDHDPNAWISKVASKGGTTEAAIDSMKENDVSKLINQAAFAAFERAVELGEETT